jgi:release factor glutamine methyltransferase
VTVRDVLRDATERLAAAGVGSPRVDAELLLAHVLDVPRGALITQDAPQGEQRLRFEELLLRRERREPLQHILGRVHFRHVELAVGPGVFVPRPETELLVDAVLPFLQAGDVAVDLCSGSGALAVALADEVPGARVIAVERSAGALPWLHRNAEGTGVEVVATDVTDPVPLAPLAGLVKAVVSNPPYVPTGVAVDAEVHADPAEAVFGGTEGLDLVPSVISRAAELLRPGGVFALEHDESHGAAVPRLFAQDGRWQDVLVHPDLTGRTRYTTATRA